MIKKMITGAATLLLVLSCSGTFMSDAELGQTIASEQTAATDMVKVISAFDIVHTYKGISQQRLVEVRVKSAGTDKAVFIHQEMADGTWQDQVATFKETSGNGWETWEFSGNVYGSYMLGFGDQFVVKFVVDGVTYWDNNNGANYTIETDAGPMLANGVNVDVFQPTAYTSASGSSFYGTVDVRNLDYNKSVTIIYTTDDWATTNTVAATYGGSPFHYGYGSFDNPNIYNIERWRFNVSLPSGISEIEYCVSYDVLGTTYWDNNEGANYVIVF
jgi:hypothetical protein